MLEKIVSNRWFPLGNLVLVAVSGVIWCVVPGSGAWPLLIALLPIGIKTLAGKSPFERTAFDLLIFVYAATAFTGYWAAYDKPSAANKLWLILAAILLYYASYNLPKKHLSWIASSLFLIGVSISIYFFLTHDFIEYPRKIDFFNRIGLWLMEIRPQVPWPEIHPNYISGIAILTSIFTFYSLWNWLKLGFCSLILSAGIFLGASLILFTLIMATSRGVWMAMGSAAGVWVLWVFLKRSRLMSQERRASFFPYLVLVYLGLVVAILYLGPAQSGSDMVNIYTYGSGNRAELFSRSLYLLTDFPITGGGLESFAGLYSRYILDIPYFYAINSHNMFLDVALEQGLLGGIVFFALYLGSVWLVARAIPTLQSPDEKLFGWLTLFALIIAVVHGMVDDYLYNGVGTFLSLFLIGLSGITFRGSFHFGAAKIANATKTIRENKTHLLITSALIVALLFLYANNLLSIWYANIGANQMGKIELVGFPENGWAGSDIVPGLERAKTSLLKSVAYDATNRTANHRLGLILLLERDFVAAIEHLERAYVKAPNHRGVAKALGFCYVWSGDMEKAQEFLAKIPESKNELDVYSRWWVEQGRSDLAIMASDMVMLLESPTDQH